MTRLTRILRFLLALLLLGLVVGCGLLYAFSLEAARAWPELAHLRLLLYAAALVALVPVAAAVKPAFDLLELVDRGAAFSDRSAEVLRRLRLLTGTFAGCLGLGFVGFQVATGVLHPTLVFIWFVAQVAALFLCTLVALIERLLVAALRRRQDDERRDDLGHHRLTV
jgi:hypothetical protein